MTRQPQNQFHRLALLIVSNALLLVGCDKSPSGLSPAQAQQAATARQSTIDTAEHLLGRPLTDSEKECVHVEFHADRPFGEIAPPLSEILKRRQMQLLRSNSTSLPASGK